MSSKKAQNPAAQYRARLRARHHLDAHSAPVVQNSIPDHHLVYRGDSEWVTTDKHLAAVLDHCREIGTFGYDSEFIGESSYHPRLCLLQIATKEKIALVDPLAGVDLKPFWELCCDEEVEKVVHAGQQDVEPAVRALGKPCRNVFDTQIAAGFVGLAYPVALVKLVGEIIGAKLGKAATFTQWDARPLTPTQLRYAADDVRYLPALRFELGKQLEARGHAHLCAQRCAEMCDPAQFGFNPEEAWERIRGAGSLTGAQAQVLRALTIWRDEAAKSADLPARAIVRDEVLLDLARHPPKTIDRLSKVRGLPRPIEQQHGQAIVQATLQALERGTGGIRHDSPPEPTPLERFRAGSLMSLVEAVCAGQGIDPALVTSRHEIAELLRALQAGNSDPDTPLLRGWRRQAAGERLLQLIKGKGTFKFGWGDSGVELREDRRS
jgi:ribonuclease D